MDWLHPDPPCRDGKTALTLTLQKETQEGTPVGEIAPLGSKTIHATWLRFYQQGIRDQYYQMLY